MKPYTLARDEGEAIWMFDALDTIKADADQTAGALSAVEFLDFEGSSVPLHVKHTRDGGFYILAGEYTFVIAEEIVAASPGTWIFAARGTAHGWRCDSTQGRTSLPHRGGLGVTGGVSWDGGNRPDDGRAHPGRLSDSGHHRSSLCDGGGPKSGGGECAATRWHRDPVLVARTVRVPRLASAGLRQPAEMA